MQTSQLVSTSTGGHTNTHTLTSRKVNKQQIYQSLWIIIIIIMRIVVTVVSVFGSDFEVNIKFKLNHIRLNRVRVRLK